MTGAGSRGPGLGNGKAAAILFAREGARILCVDREVERAEETVALSIRPAVSEGKGESALAVVLPGDGRAAKTTGARTREGPE